MSRYLVCALLLTACGRFGFDSGAVDDGDVPADEMLPTGPRVAALTGAIADASGRPTQTHLVYAENAATWWLFYIDDSTSVLRAAYSRNLDQWTVAASTATTQPLVQGINFSVAYKNIAGHDVVHVALAYLADRAQHAHVRAELSATSIAWGAEETVGCVGSLSSVLQGPVDGPAVVIGHDNRVYDFTSAWNDDNTCVNNNYVGNFDVTFSNSLDTGNAWAPGWETPNYLLFATKSLTAHWGAPTVNGALTVQPEGENLDTTRRLKWSIRDGTSWSPPADVLAQPLAQEIDVNDWGAVRLSDTNHLLVIRTGDQSYVATRFDGTAWQALPQAIPDQASRAASGPFLASDGTNVWLFVIDGTAIRSTKFDGTAWSAWTTLDVPAVERTWLSGSVVVDSAVGLLWSEGQGGGSQVVVMRVPLT